MAKCCCCYSAPSYLAIYYSPFFWRTVRSRGAFFGGPNPSTFHKNEIKLFHYTIELQDKNHTK